MSDAQYTITCKNIRDLHIFDNVRIIELSESFERFLSDGKEHLFEWIGNNKWLIDHAPTTYTPDAVGLQLESATSEEPPYPVALYDAFTIKREGDATMSYKLEWDKTGERYYENGVSHGVLFPVNSDGTYKNGVAWNGLTNVTNSPEGAEPNDLWADNIKYASLRSAETFSGSIEAYTYPAEFRACIGMKQAAGGVYFGQQTHEPFGFCYRTEIGNDTPTEGDDAYKIHLVYGATVTPSEESFDTINDSPDAITFSWDFDTIPVTVPGFKPVAHIVIDSREADPIKLGELLDILYGTAAEGQTAAVEPRLPLPTEVKTKLS